MARIGRAVAGQTGKSSEVTDKENGSCCRRRLGCGRALAEGLDICLHADSAPLPASLAGTDYEIIEAENGEEALAAVAKQRPDLILMDVQLPIMDGYEATRRIKADPTLRSIPIIAVTSYALSGEDKKAREAGCDAYIPKPYSPRELLAKVRQHLSD